MGFVDDAAIRHIRDLGPVLAVAASHPHMYGCQTAWAEALDAPVVLNAHDAEWCQRTERVTFFDESYDLGPDLTLHRVGDTKPHELEDKMVDGLFTTPEYIAPDVKLVYGVSDHAAIVAALSKV